MGSTQYPSIIHAVDVQSMISFECQRLWHNEGVSFNLTWILSPDLHRSSVISSFVVDLKLRDLMNNITSLIDTSTFTFPQVNVAIHHCVIIILTNLFNDIGFLVYSYSCLYLGS